MQAAQTQYQEQYLVASTKVLSLVTYLSTMDQRLSLLTAVLCEDVAPYVPLFGRSQPFDPRALPLSQAACHGRLAPGKWGAWGERAPAPWSRASRSLFSLLRPHHTAPRSLLTEMKQLMLIN